MEGTRGSEEEAVHSRRDLTQLVPAQDGGVAVKAQRALTLVRSAWARSNGCKSRVQEVAPST